MQLLILMTFSRWRSCIGTVLVAASLGACANLPDVGDRPSSEALTNTQHTAIARSVLPKTAQHAGQSGFHLLTNGEDALVARLALASKAEVSLDVQYYIWKDDFTGKILIKRLLQAADRGVRVRMLIDDIGTIPSDQMLLALNSHPNFEVRLFNPTPLRSSKNLGILFDFRRMNRRMHNKSFTADGQVTIVGGRNIGDEYFAANKDMNFVDLDVTMIGPVVKQVSTSFDLYWNCESAIGISMLSGGRDTEADLVTLRHELGEHLSVAKTSQYAERVRGSKLVGQLKRSVPYHWGTGRMMYDDPAKVTSSANDARTHMAPELRAEAEQANKELYLVSPYFVPGKQGVAFLNEARQGGSRVVVITNALASTDAIAVHAGYMDYRKPLLRAGIELYETKPTVGKSRQKHHKNSHGSSGASMHSKTFAFDRRTLFIGSYNLDPRSKNLNTEIGVMIDCPELAAYLPETVDRVLPGDAYRLELDGDRLVWVTQEGDREVRYDSEPSTTFGQRFQTKVLSWLPIEDLL